MTEALRHFNERRRHVLGGMADRWRALPRWQRWLTVLAGIAFLYYLPFLGDIPGTNLIIPGIDWFRTDSIDGGSNWAGVLFVCALYVLVAIGLNVVIGLAGLLDLGYVGFYAVGAYSVALFGSAQSPVVQALQRQFGLSQDWAIAWAICIPIALAFSLVAGVLLGWPTLRLRGDYLAIVTLGFGEIIRIVAKNSAWAGEAQGVPGIPGPEGPPSADNTVFGLLDIKPWYWLAVTVVLLMVMLVRRLEHSRVGRSWLAIREDEDAAAVMGVYPFKFKLWAFAIGAALGGVLRSALREPVGLHPAGDLQRSALHPVRRDGGGRRFRQHGGRRARRVPARVSAGAVPRLRGVPGPRLRSSLGAHHAAAPAGSAAE